MAQATWKINENAMYELGEMPTITPPKPLIHFVNKSLLFIRIVKRETTRHSPVERVVLLTKQYLYVCTKSGDVKRMITVTSITELVQGQKNGVQQLLLKIPEQDLILTFVQDKVNPPTATMEEFIRLLQLIFVAWRNSHLPVRHLASNLSMTASLQKPADAPVEDPQHRMEHMVTVAKQNAPPPIASPELQRHMEEIAIMHESLRKVREELSLEQSEKDKYQREHDMLLAEVNKLKAAESIANLPAAMGIRYAQTNAHAENIIAAADELQHENDELRAQIDHYKSIVEGSRVSGAQASQQLTTEIESLQAEIELEKANQEKHAKAARSHKILSQLVATICYQNVHKLVSMYEGNYNKAMHAKDTALDLAQKRVDELQHNLMKISITGVQPRGVGTYSHPSLTPIQQPQQQQMDHPLLNLMGGSQSGVGVGSASPNRVRAGSIPNTTNTSRHLMESPPKSASAKKMLSAKFL